MDERAMACSWAKGEGLNLINRKIGCQSKRSMELGDENLKTSKSLDERRRRRKKINKREQEEIEIRSK